MLIGKLPQFAALWRILHVFCHIRKFAHFEQQSIINLVGQKRYHYQNNYPETKRLPFYVATP